MTRVRMVSGTLLATVVAGVWFASAATVRADTVTWVTSYGGSDAIEYVGVAVGRPPELGGDIVVSTESAPPIPAGVPYHGSVVTPAAGGTGASAGASYDFTGSGFSTTFDFVRTGGFSDSASVTGFSYFSVGDNATFDLSGQITTDRVSQTYAGESQLFVQIYDLTESQSVFPEVTLASLFVGKSQLALIHGDLVAGHVYAFEHQAYLYAGAADGGATASGWFSLAITPSPSDPSGPAAAPSPGVAASGLALLGGVLLAGRRRCARADG
jgi:hypothetical protein